MIVQQIVVSFDSTKVQRQLWFVDFLAFNAFIKLRWGMRSVENTIQQKMLVSGHKTSGMSTKESRSERFHHWNLSLSNNWKMDQFLYFRHGNSPERYENLQNKCYEELFYNHLIIVSIFLRAQAVKPNVLLRRFFLSITLFFTKFK